jgi:TfoX/Sxy family transcriptional regulator of competence genes
MAYDEDLAYRIREAVGDDGGVTERRMFGGLAFLVNGNLAVSASGRGGMLLRVDPAHGETLLREACARPFEMRGRELAGWLHIDTSKIPDDAAFRRWVAHGVSYAKSLPPKGR